MSAVVHGVALTAEEALFLDVVTTLAAREIAPLAARIDAENAIPDAVWDVLAANELLTVGLPETAGGGGARLPVLLLTVECLAAASPAVAMLVLAAHVCGSLLAQGPANAAGSDTAPPGLDALGGDTAPAGPNAAGGDTAPPRRASARRTPPILGGWPELPGTLATPPELGGCGALQRDAGGPSSTPDTPELSHQSSHLHTGHPPALADGLGAPWQRVSAVPTSGGWRLDGSVGRVEHARASAALVVLAAAEDGRLLALRVVPDAPGVCVGPPRRRTGLRGVLASSVTFTRCPVAAADVVAEGESVGAARQLARLGGAAQAVGLAGAALAAASAYTAERHQFGAPIGSFGAVRAMLAVMATRVEAAGAYLHAVAARPDALQPAAAPACARAARAATDAAVETTVDAVQLHGGYGYVGELPIERMLRDAVSLRARAGGRGLLAEAAGVAPGVPGGA